MDRGGLEVIKLIDNLYIKTDSLNYVLCREDVVKKGARAGELTYQHIGYFSDIRGAINGAYKYSVKQKLNTDNIITLDQALNIINSVFAEYEKLLKQVILEEKEI